MNTTIPSGAQTLDRGEINGTIRDESGAVLPDVAVTLRDTKTGFERNTVSAATGQYSGLLLPLGVYVVQAELAGFSVAKSDPLPLTVGQALVVNLVMKVAAVTETVEVSAAPGNTAPALGTVIDDKAIVSLPNNGRDYRDFALLSPTARSITGTRGTFRVAGQPGDYLALNVDGADFTNNFFGEFFGSLETAIVPGSLLARLLGPPAIQYVDPGFRNPRVLHMNASGTRATHRRDFQSVGERPCICGPPDASDPRQSEFRLNNQTLGPRLAQVGVRLDF
jgi:hypothetical protein